MKLSEFERLVNKKLTKNESNGRMFTVDCPHAADTLTFRETDEEHLFGGCGKCKDVMENSDKYEKKLVRADKLEKNYEKSLKKVYDTAEVALPAGDFEDEKSWLRGFLSKHGTISIMTNVKHRDKAHNEYLSHTGDELDDTRYCNFIDNKKSAWALSWRISSPMVKELDKLLNFLTEDSRYWPTAGNAVDCPRIEKGQVVICRNSFVEELLQTGFRIGKDHDENEVETYTENKEDFENAKNAKL